MDGTGPVVDVGCDGPSGTYQDYGLQTLLGLLGGLGLHPLDGLGDDFDLGGLVDTDTDVVSALDLQDDYVLAAELVMRHQDSFVRLTGGLDGQRAAFLCTCVPELLRQEFSIHNVATYSVVPFIRTRMTNL